MHHYLELLVSIKTSQSGRARVKKFDLPNILHLVVDVADSDDVIARLDVIRPYVNKIDCVLLYSWEPNLVFDSLLKQNSFTLLASKLWILPQVVAAKLCSGKHVAYSSKWPPKMLIQCFVQGDIGPEKVVTRLPKILEESIIEVQEVELNTSRNHIVKMGSMHRLRKSIMNGVNRMYWSHLTDGGRADDEFEYWKHSPQEKRLIPYRRPPQLPRSRSDIWMQHMVIPDVVCLVQGWEGYGCRANEKVQKVRVLGIYSPPYWLESDYSEKEGCLGLAYMARVFTQLDQIGQHGKRNRAEEGIQKKCVDGFGLELLRKLASDVGFKYSVAVLNNSQFSLGQNWTQVAQLVHTRAIDIVIGQIPASVALLQQVSFSTPYRYDSLCITVQRRFQGATLTSFLRPLNVGMFVSICITVNTVAIGMACLEWNSPFGLTPRGRNRSKVFSLPSALTLCWSILLGHTTDSSTPKSWSARWLMNMWAALCVYFLASYTAKLAVYMIGRTTYLHLSGINDPKILSGEVLLGTVEGSYAHEHLEKFYEFQPDQAHPHYSADEGVGGNGKQLKLYNNLSHALSSLQSGDIDGIVFARGVMEHLVSSNFHCRLYIVGNPFAHIQYSIMLNKHDLQSQTWFNLYLGIYHSNMQIEDMLDKWRKGVQCDHDSQPLLVEPQLSVNHCLGLFLMLLIGVALGLIGNMVERVVGWMVKRKLAKDPGGRKWLLNFVRPLSQRLYRCVQSDEFDVPGLSSIVTSISQFWTRPPPPPPSDDDDVITNQNSNNNNICRSQVIANRRESSSFSF
ncbi:glutamate receptor ionotropic, NMDA 3A-like [Symsagittifera roscoffensis]|uniref:glutamate receptor ionotropic, NMDA 3A-like n=1 Tax=Symsagittifera roscoffensis TaxID=84072 RepID=UPI00307C07A3